MLSSPSPALVIPGANDMFVSFLTFVDLRAAWERRHSHSGLPPIAIPHSAA
jgi:hypothetical protein